jgi:hypothetical protein
MFRLHLKKKLNERVSKISKLDGPQNLDFGIIIFRKNSFLFRQNQKHN